MSEQDESEVEHTLFIVERDDLDDAVPYQVMKAEHPPDSEQAKALEGVMCQLVEEAEAETGEPHRLVTEADTPEVTQAHYETHEERIEGETLVTDGGVDQSEAAIDRDPVELTLTPEDINRLVNGEEVVWTGTVAGMTVYMKRREYDNE